MNLHVWKDVDYRGRLVRLDYTTKDISGNPWYKYALVYLPYGYDDTKPYNILYLMHGGGGNPDAWTDCSQIKNALDQAFNDKLAEPFIVVFPTWRGPVTRMQAYSLLISIKSIELHLQPR